MLMNENANKIPLTTNGEAMIPNWIVERYILKKVTSLYINNNKICMFMRKGSYLQNCLSSQKETCKHVSPLVSLDFIPNKVSIKENLLEFHDELIEINRH